MPGKIERMNRFRNVLVKCVFIGTLIAFGLFMYPFLSSAFGPHPFWDKEGYLEAGLLVWLLTMILFAVVYKLYKGRLKKDPLVREAVNDERVKTNWLRSYRFAFYAVIVVNVIYKIYESFWFNWMSPQKILLPHPPWLTLFVGILSVAGTFLYYNREARDG